MQPSPNPTAEPSFDIEHSTRSEPLGRFTPNARLAFGAGLRSCGLLGILDDEQARTLLAVLSCLTPNGRIQAAAPEIAAILRVPERQANDRLRRLAAVQWRGEPLLRELPRETGPSAFAPSPGLVGERDEPTMSAQAVDLPIPAASRDAVLAHSRERYGTERAVAERMVAEQLGRSPEESEDTLEGAARRAMRSVGVSRGEADRLVASYSVEAISRQLAWLPLRGAKSPARFLVAAVEGDYAPPQSSLPIPAPSRPDPSASPE